MSQFNQLQSQLKILRSEHLNTAKEIFALRHRLKLLEDKLQKLKRSFHEQDRQEIELKSKLEKEKLSLISEIETLSQRKNAFRSQSKQLFTSLIKLDDPTKQIEELSDAFPFVLLPLRLETRFKKNLQSPPQSVYQLWVRIYPDTCHIESREELISQFELQNAKLFWLQMWQAGGIAEQQRGAWRSLVNSHGSGRASWIIEQYKPLNIAKKPSKTDPTDIILVVTEQMPLTSMEEDAAFSFWKALWLADGDSGKENLALQSLKASVGDSKAEEIQQKFKPFNLSATPQGKKKNEVTLSAAKVVFPQDETIGVSKSSWQQAPKAKTLPDRFVVTCLKKGQPPKQAFTKAVPDSLPVGPDPSLPDSEQIKQQNGELLLNEELQWMTDFEKAIEVGMGVKINLTEKQWREGFDSLIVLGLKLSADETEGRYALENLLLSHYYSSHGFGLLPQGIPTNNTDGEGSGFSRIDDADTSYDIVFNNKEVFEDSEDSFSKKDGQWLAEILGLGTDTFKKIPFAGGSDQSEARAMNTALWPATLGYFMDEMMEPIFSDAQIEKTRTFFNQFVSARGPVPAIRIGKQPYGILPVSVFSRLDFKSGASHFRRTALAERDDYFVQLHKFLTKIDKDWEKLLNKVPFIGKSGDAHQVLLDVIGLHGGSVEFHQRYAETIQQVYNQLNLAYGPMIANVLVTAISRRGKVLLNELGYDFQGKKIPILEKFFMGKANPLTGPVIDDVPLSENKKVRAYSADEKNYIEWLVSSGADTIRKQDFGTGKNAPSALLYLLLRHSMMQAQSEASKFYYLSRGLMNHKKVFHDPDFMHVQKQETAKSKWSYLYSNEPSITGDTSTLVADYILKPSVLKNDAETKNLKRIIDALKALTDTPTARLDRLFSEHLDTCNYRLDAWKTALVQVKLSEQRKLNSDGEWSKGVYLGAYGYLEKLVPQGKQLSNVKLDAELNHIFNTKDEAPLLRDTANAGYIHAPSLNQAATAAILRNAYLSNATGTHPENFSINLSSQRVRLAQGFLEGVRNGQSLAALLGYQFERGLHDTYSLGKGEVDKFIYPLRKKFPLVSNHLKTTKTTGEQDAETSIESIEARNVIDGLKLIKHVQKPGNKNYPFGFETGNETQKLPVATSIQQAAINKELQRILYINDAISDIVMAENVYQVVQGNIERASGNTEAFSKGQYPPDIEVVQTPRSGISLTHRVAVLFDTDADPSTSPNTVVNMTPRAKAEAPLNKWLSSIVPDADNVKVWVHYKNPSITLKKVLVSQKQLNIQPIDLLYILQIDTEQSLTELDDRIIAFIKTNHSAHPYTEIKIHYTAPVDPEDLTKVSFFELGALIKSLRTVVMKSRHLHGADCSLPQESQLETQGYNTDECKTRIQKAVNALDAFTPTLSALQSDASDLDLFSDKVITEFLKIAEFGIPQTGVGFITLGIQSIYHSIFEKLKELLTRWQKKDADFTALIAGYNGAGPSDEMFALLTRAERLISSKLTVPLPVDFNTYKTLVDAKKNAFDIAFNVLKPLIKSSKTSLAAYFSEVEPALSIIGVHDVLFFDSSREKNDITKEKEDAARLRDEIKQRVTNLKEDIEKRLDAAGKFILEADKEKTGGKKIDLLLSAAKQVLGDDAIVLPQFSLLGVKGNEMENSFSDSNNLLDFIKLKEHKTNPVEEWFYGTARVRSKMFHLENTAVLSENFNNNFHFVLTPLQIPYRSNDRWLAMKFRSENNPEKFSIGSDTLLFTVHSAIPFTKTKPQSGILVDEWTEVIPAKEETTGIAFHYDQPNSEPPQVILLAVPPKLTGKWHYRDLLDTIQETMDMAKKRAIEPAQIESTAYAQFLPTTMMAVTLYLITLSTNLAINNSVYEKLK
jgi:archaellum component FlaC